MEWVETANATYVYVESQAVKLEGEIIAHRIRGRCLGYARQLNDGSWEAKLCGSQHHATRADSRADAHRELKRLVYGNTKAPRKVSV